MVAIRLPLFATFREISILMYAKRVIIPGHVPGEMLVTLASYSNSRAPFPLLIPLCPLSLSCCA